MLAPRSIGALPTAMRSLRSFASTALGEPWLTGGTIDVETLDLNLYRSRSLWRPPGARGVYGGQVVGQALTAAQRTLEQESAFPLHSMHSYFLLPGDASRPILYRVKRLRDGASFVTRSVVALQNGKAIFNLQASYQKPEESDLIHQSTKPAAPDPNSLPSMQQILEETMKDPRCTPAFRASAAEALKMPFNVDLRYVDRPDYFKPPVKREARQLVWMKAYGKLPDDMNVHRAVMAYASDWGLAGTALLPHGLMIPHPRIKMIASLDHAVWFHGSNFRADEWNLFEMESPRAAGGRPLIFGRLYDMSGSLQMTVAQEAIVRLHPKRPSSSKPKPAATVDAPTKEATPTAK